MIRIADPNYSTDPTACYSCGFGQATATTPERRTARYRLGSADVAGVETGDMIFLHIECHECGMATRAAIDQPTYPYSDVYCSACQLRP